MDPKKLLWVDCIGGGVVGVLVLVLARWLSDWYRLPYDFVIMMGIVNLAYGSYSFTLAMLSKRPMPLIRLLVFTNLLWMVLCLRWAVIFYGTASILGMAQLIIEGLYVGGLGCVEWRFREQLREKVT